jgi:two-component system, NtrC family, sensor histidine kinase KinB
VIKTIRSKIVWTFAALVLLNLASGFWSIFNFYSLGTTVSNILHENYQSVLAAENMVKSLVRADKALLDASEYEASTATGTVNDTKQLFLGYSDNRDLFYYWYDQAVRTVSLPSQDTLRDSIQTAYRQYAVLADSMTARIGQGAFREAKQYYYENVRPYSDRIQGLCLKLFEINQAAMDNTVPRTHAIANQIAYGTMMTSIITLALSVIGMVWITRVVVTPAEELTERVKQIGAGKLDLKIDVLSDDEFGQLSREFNKMTERLKRFEQMNIDKIISEKRKSEAIVESISDGLIVTDASMNILHMNRVVAELCNVKPGPVIGEPLGSVIRDDRIIALIRACSESGGDQPDQKVHYLEFERGDQRWFFRPKVARIVDAEGDLYGVLTLLQDVTQFKELDRMKSDFIATLSHEFRTPLTSMNMSVDILSQGILGPLNERQRELITSAKEDCFRLTKLARELLQLSKLESGKIQLKNEELDIQSVIDLSIRPLALQFNEKQIRLLTNVEPGLPRLIADEQQISWVITNLVTNALRYTDAGGTVSIRARAQGRATGSGNKGIETVLVEVEDTGQGIARENLDKIFDKFVQIKGTAGSTPGSVGLGLAIAKEIVEIYGGKIWAESEPGKGSKFSVVLPLGSGLPRQGERESRPETPAQVVTRNDA